MTVICVPELYEEGCVCDAISLHVPSFQKEMCLHHRFLIALTLSAMLDGVYVIPCHFFSHTNIHTPTRAQTQQEMR